MSKKLFGKVFIFLLVVGLLFAAAPTRQAQAADIPVVCLGTDDTALLQGAITGAADGDVINVSGTCVLTANITVSKDVTLDGGGTASIKVSGTGYRITMTTAGATLQGFDIEKTDKTGGQDIIWINASNVTIANNKVHGQFVIGEDEVSRAIVISGGNSGLMITGNQFYSLRQPAYISGVTTGTISGNYTAGTKGWVVEQGDMTFTNNTWGTGVDANVYDIAILSGVDSAYYTDVPAISVANNNAFIEDQRYSPARLTPVYVNASAPACTDCGTARMPYDTIQEGVDRVIPGGTVKVFPGTYNETASDRTLDSGGTYQFGLFFGIAKPGITLQGVKADGSVITNAADVVASIKTNATNSFGYSGVFVEADNITITGLEFLDNYVGGSVDNNKTLEVLGNNFIFKDNIMSVTGGGSLYLNDWSFNSGTGNSRFESYNISENLFKLGASVDISSGVGVSGAASGRVIADNTFTADGEDVYWANISFNGTIPSVGWFVYPVGGATITGNTFIGGEIPIRSRGIVEDDFDWASYITENNFEKAVIAWDPVADEPRAYDYTSGTYTLNNVIMIGTIIQDEIGHAQPGDEVRVIKGTFNEAVNVNKAVTIVGTGNIETFTDPITIGATQAPETWYTDRYAPGVFANSTFLGEPVLLHGIRAVDLQPTPFYNTQGRKFDIGLTGPTQLISIDMFVGEDWGTKTRYSGLWATGFDSANAASSYPIVAFRNAEGDGPGFFGYEIHTGEWIKLRDAVAEDYGKWHTFEIEQTVGIGVKYFVDGELLLTLEDDVTVSLGNVILNVKNYGEDYDVYWDNFAAHDTKVIGQMSINASDVAIEGLILSNPGQSYGMVIDDLVSNIDITENIFVDIGSPTLTTYVKGIYLQYGPDNVLIKDNLFEGIHAGTKAVNAIFSGDSNSTSPAEQLQIRDNRFLNISSASSGGYGVLLNNGAGNPSAIIDGNRFSGISGGWTHAIGLEGPTPNASVTGNTFYNLTALSADNLAVLFEANPVGDTVEVSGNRFQNVGYGVGINPNDLAAYDYEVDATLNYWGSPCGPAAGVADVGPNVTYNPIYTNVELTATGAGVSGSYTFPTGSTTEFMNATIACAAPGSILTFDGSYPGGIIIPADRTDLTFKLTDDTVITDDPDAAPFFIFNIFGDYIRIEAENTGEPKLVAVLDGIQVNYSPSTYLQPADTVVTDLIIDGLEIIGDPLVLGFGIVLDKDMEDVQIINNYIHDFNTAIVANDDITGRFDIQGNMFKGNAYNISNFDIEGPTPEFVATYNSWGVYADPTATIVGDATYVPWTHMELFIEQSTSTSTENTPWVAQLVSDGTMDITYDVIADMSQITGAEFLLKIPAGLTVKSTSTANVFDLNIVEPVTGGLKYSGAQFSTGAAGSPPVTGQAITLFTVTLTASTPGTYDLTIDETTDVFSMLPPMEPAPSTWVYLDEAHKATLKAITLPTMTTTLTANYEIGVVQTFTVTITNPTTGGEFTDPVMVFTDLPTGTTLEYFDGTNWVPFTGAIIPDLTIGATPVVVDLQFRVTFTAPAGAYPITITLNDSLTDPDEFLAQTSGTATVTLLTTPVVGTLSMQGRAYRGEIPMTLTPTTLTGFTACTEESINHISDNITFVACLVGDTYVITTNQERYLDVTVYLNKTINLLTPDYIITALELKAGDADDSNKIDVSDAGIVGGSYGVGTNVRGDLNFDGKFNVQDLALVGGNYGYDTSATGTDATNPYLTWVP